MPRGLGPTLKGMGTSPDGNAGSILFRCGYDLRDRINEAAKGARMGQHAWLVAVVEAALGGDSGPVSDEPTTTPPPPVLTGYAAKVAADIEAGRDTD